MNKVKILFLSIGISTIFACFLTAYAGEQVAFAFENVGDKQSITRILSSGNKQLYVHVNEGANATLGLSLTKNGIIDTFISRCNKSILGKYEVTCTWDVKKATGKGTYTGTTVLNTKDSSYTNIIYGSMDLYVTN